MKAWRGGDSPRTNKRRFGVTSRPQGSEPIAAAGEKRVTMTLNNLQNPIDFEQPALLIDPRLARRTVDDLIRMAQPGTAKQARLLLDFSQLTHDHPELFVQLAALVYSRLETNSRAASAREAFERLRWDSHIQMSNDLVTLMGRALLYVHPDLTGMVQLNSRPLDEALGMRVSPKKLPGDYARRLEWCDGRPLTEAPTPPKKKTAQSVRPNQGELFEVAG